MYVHGLYLHGHLKWLGGAICHVLSFSIEGTMDKVLSLLIFGMLCVQCSLHYTDFEQLQQRLTVLVQYLY